MGTRLLGRDRREYLWCVVGDYRCAIGMGWGLTGCGVFFVVFDTGGSIVVAVPAIVFGLLLVKFP